MSAQEGAFITESVLRLIAGGDQSRRDRLEGGGDDRGAGAAWKRGGGGGDGGGVHTDLASCNPLVWQASNAGLVDQKVRGFVWKGSTCTPRGSVFDAPLVVRWMFSCRRKS